jgi:2-aminoethylphosphonate-pyruvate transaminase
MKHRLLFSPGPIPVNENIDISFSHRDTDFGVMYGEVVEKLLQLVYDSHYNDVILTQGSASSAIETVLSSVLIPDSKILMLVNGSFGKRAKEMAQFNTANIIIAEDVNDCEDALETEKGITHFFAVQFETSVSKYNHICPLLSICKTQGIVSIVDSVSAFPYYGFTETYPDFLITSASKQLGTIPAMGIIFYDKNKNIPLFEKSDYLNLKKYMEYSLKKQTPHTSLIPQFISLYNQLIAKFYDGTKIRQNRHKIIRNAIILTEGLADNVVNDAISPVVTIQVKNTAEVVRRLNTDGIKVYYNLFYMKDYIQVSTFNYDSIEPYLTLNKYLVEFKKDGLI